MNIREATSRDIAAMADLHARAFAFAWDDTSLRALLNGPGVFALLSQDDEPCGFILIRVVADETEILTLAVGPDRRRQGLASLLLEHAAARAATDGAARMFLEVASANLPARNLYKKYGFREAGTRKAYYEDGDDALVLSASLPLIVGNSAETL